MKKILLLLSIIVFQFAYAQTKKITSNQFLVTGKVVNEKTITIADILKYPSTELNEINTSCSPKKEEKAKSVKVVLLKTILENIKFSYENSKMLGQYYFLFVSVDDYKTVFSFNEIYNTDIGNNLFIVTEIDGKKIEDMDNSILLLSTKDIKGGSRNIKGLSKIVVCAAN